MFNRVWKPWRCRKSSLACEDRGAAMRYRRSDCVWSMMAERSGYVLPERGRSVAARVSRRSCSSAVALVLSGGLEAAVEERCRRIRTDILLHVPDLPELSRPSRVLHRSHAPWKFQAEAEFDGHRIWLCPVDSEEQQVARAAAGRCIQDLPRWKEGCRTRRV